MMMKRGRSSRRRRRKDAKKAGSQKSRKLRSNTKRINRMIPRV